MEKRDIIVIIVAICVVLVMALYIKPLVTGKEAKLIPDEMSGMFSKNNESSSIPDIKLNDSNDTTANASENNVSQILQNVSSDENMSFTDNVTPIPTKTPILPWNGTPLTLSPGTIIQQSVVPREYGTSYQRYSFKEPATPLKTYTTITGSLSQKTAPFAIPSKYWEIWYSVELPEDLQNPKLEEQSDDESKVQSVSAVNPSFEFTVINADTNQVIRKVTPTGGLDPKVWKGTFGSGEDSTSTIKSDKGEEIEVNWDPRPWKEKFFEGFGMYQLEISSRYITSYTIEIKLPDPDVVQKNVSILNNTKNTSPTSYYHDILTAFLSLYNSDFLIEPNRTNLLNLFSNEVLQNNGYNGSLQQLYYMKMSGIEISDYRIDSSFYRLSEGNLKGAFIWNRNGKNHQTEYDIPFIAENGLWKIDILPIIRF